MPNIIKVLKFVNGVAKQIDPANDSIAAASVFVGGVSGREITLSIMNYLSGGSSTDATSLHNHDSRYYTQSQITSLISGLANTNLSNLSSPTAINQNLLFGSDNTLNIGGLNNRPKDVMLSGDLYIGGTASGSTTSTSHLYFGSQNTSTSYISSATSVLGTLTLSNGLLLAGSTSGTVSHKAADATTTYQLKWPGSQGTGSLTNDGVGNLSWASSSGVTLSGSAGVPTIVTSGGNTSGIYSSAADTIDFAISGVKRLEIDANGGVIFSPAVGNNQQGGAILAKNTGANQQGPAFVSYNSTVGIGVGFYLAGATGYIGTFNSSGVITGDIAGFSTAGIGMVQGVIKSLSGSAAAPGFSFTTDPSTGMYRSGASTLDFATGGVNRLKLNSGVISNNGTYHLEASEFSNGNSGTAITIDLSTGSAQAVTITANVTFTLSNSVTGGTYTLRLVQDATGSRTYTWPGTVKWSNGTAPTGSGANKVDLIKLYYDGSFYYGYYYLNY